MRRITASWKSLSNSSLLGFIRTRVRAGDCSHGNDRSGSPALSIPTSDIFYAQNFAQLLAIFKASQLQ